MSKLVTFEGVTWQTADDPDSWYIVGGTGNVWLFRSSKGWSPQWDLSCSADTVDTAEDLARELLAACAFARHLNEQEGKA